jgi:hypothetical protein
MADRWALRWGGISGILFVVLLIPGIFIGRPDVPEPGLSGQEVHNYFSGWRTLFMAGNGVSFIFAAFFFLWFLGILRNVLRSTEGEGEWLSTVALSGGLIFITLELAGAAAEIVYPAALARFANFQPDAQLAFLSLALSGWLYNFAWVGLSVLIAAASALALWIRRLPRWLGWAGFVFAVLALSKFLTPLAHTVALLWVLVVSALMLAGRVSFSRRATT